MARRTKIKHNAPAGPFYADFRDNIKNILTGQLQGRTLAEIKNSVNFSPDLPINTWVQKLEKDIGLIITREGKNWLWKIENDTISDVGYEGKTAPDFIKVLKDNNIELVVDVRAMPLSRKKGFSKGVLAETIKQSGIGYKHTPALGAPKEIREKLHKNWDYKTFFKEYKDHVKDSGRLDELNEVEKMAKGCRLAIMCFEKEHERCHRQVLIEMLIKRGWKIKHLE
jgi:hypothetical protein